MLRELLRSVTSGVRERLRALDADLARQALRDFERHHGIDLRAPRVTVGDLPRLVRVLTPEGRPLVEHHWATWCAPCLDELARVEALAGRLDGVADVVGVSWDRFDQDDPDVDATVARVAAVCRTRGLSWPTVVFDGAPDALLEALALPAETVPQTRVRDADGGILKVFPGPLSDADVAAVVALLGEGAR